MALAQIGRAAALETIKANQPPRSQLSRYEMNVIISQQATGN